MTVQELINQLLLVKDKTFEVVIEADRTFVKAQRKSKTLNFACYLVKDVELCKAHSDDFQADCQECADCASAVVIIAE